MAAPQRPARSTRPIWRRCPITIDGEPLLVDVRALTVAQFNQVAALVYPRGAVVSDREKQRLYLKRCRVVDQYVRGVEGSIEDEHGRPLRRLATAFAARLELGEALFAVLMRAQEVTAEERLQLVTASRFSAWLNEARQRNSPSHWVETGTSCHLCHEQKRCKSRGCNGTEQPKPVWHDAKMVLKTCPVLAFTPAVEHAIRVFDWTHEVSIGSGAVSWRQVSWPRAGGLDDQDAWTVSALHCLRIVRTEILAEAIKSTKPPSASPSSSAPPRGRR